MQQPYLGGGGGVAGRGVLCVLHDHVIDGARQSHGRGDHFEHGAPSRGVQRRGR